eukprot:11187801-Lingulodinium_polyedra.AAC.1
MENARQVELACHCIHEHARLGRVLTAEKMLLDGTHERHVVVRLRLQKPPHGPQEILQNCDNLA